MTPTYKTPAHAAGRFIRDAKRAGTLIVLGGGWWQLAGRWRVGYGLPVYPTFWKGQPGVKLQGLAVLADLLERHGRLVRLDDGRAQLVPTSEECPACSRIGAGPLCKDHRGDR